MKSREAGGRGAAPAGTLILTRADVGSLLVLNECITAVEDAFRQHALASAVPPGILGVHARDGAFHVKAAGVYEPRPYFAAKVNANFRDNRARYGLPTIQAVIVLMDLENGSPLAVMDSIEITIQRTGAATAVAAKYLARESPAVVTIVGCGLQGRVQLQSIAAVRMIAEVQLFDEDEAAAQRFAAELLPTHGARVRVVKNLPEALRRSDIVVTCTTAHAPIVHPGDLKAGAFVAAVGADNPDKQEIDAAVMASSTVVVDVLDQAATIGDLHHALSAGLMTTDGVQAELGEIVTGRKPGRRTEDEIIIFDSTGMALQDVVAAALVYERAVERGVGTRIPLAPRERSRDGLYLANMRFLAPATIVLSLSLGASGRPAFAQRARPSSDSTTVVFVCEHGSVKSLVAISFFNDLARARGLPFRAISRGTHPDSAVPMAIRDGLKRDGYDVSRFQPKLFGAADLPGSRLFISFDQDITPVVRGAAPVEWWDGLPALSSDYGIGRDSIRARVEALVAKLSRERKRSD